MHINVIKMVHCKVTYPDGTTDNGLSRMPPNHHGQCADEFFTMQKVDDAKSGLLINLSHIAKIEYKIEYEEK